MTTANESNERARRLSGTVRRPGVRRLVGAAETDGRFAMIETTEASGGGPPCHQHEREDEALFVLDGSLIVWQAGLWTPAPAGTAIWLPRASEHTYVVTEGPARLLVFVAPAGLERFFTELGGQPRDSLLDAELLVTIAARYGVEITGPSPRP